MKTPSRAAALALSLCLPACASGGGRPVIDGTQALAPADVEDDLAQLSYTLHRAVPLRGPYALALWHAFDAELHTLATRAQDPRTFCAEVGDALRFIGRFEADATPDTPSGRCRWTTWSAHPIEGTHWGDNIAARSERLYVLRTDTTEPAVMVLGIRHFASREAPEWEGFAEAIERASHAPGLVIDLRGADGDDPSAVLPLVASLTGRSDLHPIRAIARAEGADVDALRAAYAVRHGGVVRRPAEVWRARVGDEGPPDALTTDVLHVVVGDRCGPACELIARMLQTYVGATVDGYAGTAGRMDVDEPGALRLQHSGVELVVPTVAYVLNRRIARATGVVNEGDRWSARVATALPTTTPDPLERLVGEVRGVVEANLRVARVEHPRACASYPPISRIEDLPPAARARLRTDGSPLESDVQIIATIDLPGRRADAYVRSCPGVTSGGGTGDSMFIAVESFEALSRLLQSDVVRLVTIGQRTTDCVNGAP